MTATHSPLDVRQRRGDLELVLHPPSARWHQLDAAEAAVLLGTGLADGLDGAEAARRLLAHGPNTLAERRARGPLRMLLAQFADVMVLVLLGAAIIAAILGEPADVVAIAVIVALNAVLGFVQEYRAERAMAALRAMAAPAARVRRDGVERSVDAHQLVPGDLVLLEAGNVVPSDLRLVEVARLEVNESALTGESLPVAKVAMAIDVPDLALGDRRNLAFKGTTVTYGRGVGLVIATGMATELGRIASLLSAQDEVRTPLQERLGRLGKGLAIAVLLLCGAMFGIGLLRGEAPGLMLLTAVSLAVAAVPEALPAVVTISLALGARRMARQNALIRQLPAVETLGSVTFICSDKTGTLTQNRMRVEAIRAAGASAGPGGSTPSIGSEPLLLEALSTSNDVRIAADGTPIGDPTEIALREAALTMGADLRSLEAELPRVAELPFSSERARMTTVHRRGMAFVAFTKGAPERVLAGCTSCNDGGTQIPLNRDDAIADAHAMAASGLRVLAVACRELRELPPSLESVEDDQTLLALVGLMDPPRDEAREAVATCQAAGIRVVMITGDHPATAGAVAAALGIADPAAPVVTGQDLARLDDRQLLEDVEQLRVYARVAPEDKIRIVRALQDRGQHVAMTGDGVNDAPALRRASIGVAMGLGGTDVAREAADMVLLDDNFASIVRAVREGRRIYGNIRKFVRYVLTGNVGEIWAMFMAPMLGLPIPLLPLHILWVNLVTDGLPGLALAAEPEERDAMLRPPRPPAESIFAGGLWQHVLWVGVLLGSVTLLVQWWALRTGAHWQSMAFTVLTLSQMAHVLAIRSERASLFQHGMLGNVPLLAAVALTFGLQLSTLYVPAAQTVFRTSPLSGVELGLCILASAVVFLGVEAEKWLIRHRGLYQPRGNSAEAAPSAVGAVPVAASGA